MGFRAGYNKGLRIRITLNADLDPAFHFIADTDPAFYFTAVPDPAFYFNADPDPSFYFNAYPDPAFHSNKDPDTDLAFKNNADPDPQPWLQRHQKAWLSLLRFLFHGLAAGCKKPPLYSWAMCISDAALDSWGLRLDLSYSWGHLTLPKACRGTQLF